MRQPSQPSQRHHQRPVIVVHGGAGDRPPAGRAAAAARTGCMAAARAGWKIMDGGGSALDAVEAAVRQLEDDPRFNAGRGSCLTRDGTVEMDASIMDGCGLRIGAVAVISGVRNPITLARRVMEDGEHVLLAGPGAVAFAREQERIALVHPAYHITPAARAALARELARRSATSRARRSAGGGGGGTVGAVARDAAGRLAAATSTGGMIAKRPGRIGDSPIAGAGTYADDQAGAASATGHGERIVQVSLTKLAIDLLARGVPAQEAASTAIAELGSRVQGRAGLILVDRSGAPAAAFNTRSMAWAMADRD